MTPTGDHHFSLVLTRAQFEKISSLLYSAAKITLQTGKEDLVKSRLQKRIRELGLGGFGDYLELVSGDPAEHYRMVDLLTTNKTSFFRENEHFEFMRARILPGLRSGRARVWSAGCSSGEEPYTIAMVLREGLGAACGDVKVLATDLSARVLEKAKAGVYDEEGLREVPPGLLAKYFAPASAAGRGSYAVRPELRSLVAFASLNLMAEWPMRGPFDLIFCRNVMIYFDKRTQEDLVNRFYGLLKPGGYLFVGHSESLAGFNTRFRYVQPAVHLKET